MTLAFWHMRRNALLSGTASFVIFTSHHISGVSRISHGVMELPSKSTLGFGVLVVIASGRPI